jgi:hypothetical protein
MLAHSCCIANDTLAFSSQSIAASRNLEIASDPPISLGSSGFSPMHLALARTMLRAQTCLNPFLLPRLP